MKKISLQLIGCLLTLMPAFGHPPKQETSLGIGVLPSNQIADEFLNIVFIASTLNNYTQKKLHYIPVIALSHKAWVSDRLALGGTFAYTSSSSELWTFNQQTGDMKVHHYTLGAEADFRYINKPKLKLYSSAGLGITLRNERYTPLSEMETSSNKWKSGLNFQITAIGIKYGSKAGVFAACGFGYKGMLHAGAFVRF